MTKEEKERKLAEDYQRYLEEDKRMLAEGKHIGTFSSWRFSNGLVSIKIPMTREEHFGAGK